MDLKNIISVLLPYLNTCAPAHTHVFVALPYSPNLYLYLLACPRPGYVVLKYQATQWRRDVHPTWPLKEGWRPRANIGWEVGVMVEST